MIIYLATNTVNGKRYVGQTCDTADVRWREHVSAAKRGAGCRLLGAAIRKYGKDAFKLEVLAAVATQAEADSVEASKIEELGSRAPVGYNLASGGESHGRHHEESKRLISASSIARIQQMSSEDRAAFFAKNIHLWTPERRARTYARSQDARTREKMAASQRAVWATRSAEERSAQVRHQLAGMTRAQKSDRVRKAWANMTPEARAERVRKARAASSGSDRIRSEKVRAWQLAQAARRTPEERSEIVRKAWATRRAHAAQEGTPG